MNKLITFSDLSNYICKVNSWLDFANEKVILLDQQTGLIATLAFEKNKICSHISNLKNPNEQFVTFLNKMELELNNFFLLENGSNVKSFENLLTTLQLEHSVLKILYFISGSQTIDAYFTLSIKNSKTIHILNKKIVETDKHLDTLLLL